MTGQSYIFFAVLVFGDVHGSKGTAPDLLFDDILIDAMFRATIVLTSYIF